MHQVGRDLRYGVRLLGRSPGFAVVALVTLGLGIGAATAFFSVVDAVLLKPLPFANPQRLLVIWEKNASQNQFKLLVAGGNFTEYRKQTRTLDAVEAFQEVTVNLTAGPNGPVDAEELPAQRVTAGLFSMLGVQPVVGRLLSAEEDQPGRNTAALLSYGVWQRRFAGDGSIAGKVIRLGDQSYTVAGVMPPGFQVLDKPADIWIPLGLDPNDTRVARGRFLILMARLRPGTTVEQARAEFDTIGDRLEQADATLNRGWRPSLFPLREELTGDVRQPLLVLMGAVGFLLLMGCVNVANLLLARGAARHREIAIRAAMGASRARVVWQLLSESVLLAIAAGVLGLVLAWGVIRALAVLGSASIPRIAGARVNWRLFLFAFAVSLVAGIVFGIAPALQATGGYIQTTLLACGRGRTAARSGRLLRNVLVVSEIALAVAVLIGAGLLIRSFARLRAVDLHFQTAGLLTARLPLAGQRNAKADRRVDFVQQVESAVAAVPGVESVAAVDTLPLTDFGFGASFAVEGRPAPDPKPVALVRAVTPGYFQTVRLPLLAGRSFTAADNAGAPLVMIVSESVQRRFWPAGSAVGSRLVLDPGSRVAEIVGVVRDVKPEKIESEDWLTVYGPYAQNAFRTVSLVMRTALPPMSLAPSIERVVRRIDSQQPVADVRTMESVVDKVVAPARFHTMMLGAFALVAFVLAAVGIYGVVSCDVSQRTNEIGIRLALGAQPGDVLAMILRQAALLASTGIAAGLAIAFGLTRLMTSMLYGVKPTDAYTFVAISLLLGIVAMAASYLPSRRAMRLHPAAALRHE